MKQNIKKSRGNRKRFSARKRRNGNILFAFSASDGHWSMFTKQVFPLFVAQTKCFRISTFLPFPSCHSPHSIGQPIFFDSHCCLYRNMQMFALRRFHLSFLPISAQSTFLSRRVFLVAEIEVNDLATGDQRGSMV